MDLGAVIMKFLQHRICNGAAHTAADHADLFLALSNSSLAQGAHEVLEIVTLVQMAELLCGGAHSLDDDGNSPFFGIVIVDSDGNTLAILIYAENDELARLGLLCDQRRFDFVQGHSGPECLFSDDTIHMIPSFPNDEIKTTYILPYTHY